LIKFDVIVLKVASKELAIMLTGHKPNVEVF